MTPFQTARSFTQSPMTGQNPNPSGEQLLSNILQQQNTCLEQVISLLKLEHEAIVQRDLDSMGKLLDKKLPLLSQLDQLDKQRQASYQQLSGLPYSDQNFAEFINQHPCEVIQTFWQSIKTQLPECKNQNDLNGRIINIRKDNTDQILQILLGRPQNNAQTYSHLGQTRQQKRSALYTSV